MTCGVLFLSCLVCFLCFVRVLSVLVCVYAHEFSSVALLLLSVSLFIFSLCFSLSISLSLFLSLSLSLCFSLSLSYALTYIRTRTCRHLCIFLAPPRPPSTSDETESSAHTQQSTHTPSEYIVQLSIQDQMGVFQDLRRERVALKPGALLCTRGRACALSLFLSLSHTHAQTHTHTHTHTYEFKGSIVLTVVVCEKESIVSSYLSVCPLLP